MGSKNNLFIDSSYFCALYNPSDSLYQKAQHCAEYVNDYTAFTSNFVVLESITVISQRVGKSTAIAFGDLIKSQSLIKLFYHDAEDEKFFWQIFKQISNKNISYVDCSILALAKRGNIDTILTFDTHFSKYVKKYNFSLLT